jgi:carbon storage regulator
VVLAQFSLALAVFALGREPSRSLGSSDLSHVSKECNMLVLSRKKNESIVINDDITVVVVEIRGDKVRLGIEAPKEVPVHRREVYDAIKENEAAQNEVASPELDATEESE